MAIAKELSMVCEICQKSYKDFDPNTIDEWGSPKYYTYKEQNVTIYFCSAVCSFDYYERYQNK